MKCHTRPYTGCTNEASEKFTCTVEREYAIMYFRDIDVCKECAEKIVRKELLTDFKMTKI